MGEYGAVMCDEEVPLIVRHLGRCVEYEPTWRAMQAFTATRTPDTPDELWLLEHSPVYTLGQAGKPEHLLHSTAIPVIHIDRGGQITYHGPGQLVLYTLIDLRRRGYGIRELVRRIEQAVIGWLETQNIAGDRLSDAPGVYVNGAKIAALGLRVKHGCTYHGLALNLDMDLTPFLAINPCGFAGMVVTDCRSEHADFSPVEPGLALAAMLKRELCRQPILGGGYAGYS